MKGGDPFSCRAAACLNPKKDAKEWSIFFINDEHFTFDKVVLIGFGHSFGGMGSVEEIGSSFYSFPPNIWTQLWFDSDFEMRMSFTILVKACGRQEKLLADFPKLYRRKKSLKIVERIGLPGVVVPLEPLINPPPTEKHSL